MNKWKIANTHSDTILLSPQNSGPEKRRPFLFSQSDAYIWTNSIGQIRWVETKQALEFKVRNGNPDLSKGKTRRYSYSANWNALHPAPTRDLLP